MHTDYKVDDIIDNRYKLDKFIGSGRVGKVYLATDTSNNCKIAIKLLANKLQSEKERNLFKREFASIKSLNHPGVVKVFEQGTNYFTMEHIEGKSLCTLKEKDFSEIFETCVEITRILDYIHKQGVIHRDLKPDNIRLDNRLKPKILDFGFATWDEHQDFLKPQSHIMGTLDYMAPEMLKGFQIDPRADLYSLGIVFYELVTGQIPFKSDDVLTTVLKQMETSAVPPSHINKNVVQGFEDIIMKLMEKSPAERFESAEDLLGAMLRLSGRSEIQNIRIKTGRNVLSSAEFCGRENELEQLALGFSKTLKRKRYFAVVSGEAGIGKTALLTHFESQIEEGIISVFIDSSKKEITYPVFGQSIVHILEFFKREAPSILTEILERWDRLLWTLNPSFFEDSNYLPDTKNLSSLPEKNLAEKICDFFIEISRHSYFALFIDDIHLLDAKNSELFHTFIQKTQTAPIFICCSYSDFYKDIQSPIHKILSRFKWEKITETIELGNLNEQETKLLILTMIDKKRIEENILNKIYEISSGIPILIKETIEKLADDGFIYKKGELLHFEVDDLRKIHRPNLLEELLLAKYVDLPEVEQSLVQYAVVIGNNFSLAFITSMKNIEDIIKIIEKLTKIGFLVENNDTYTIGSNKLAQKIYDKMPISKKRHLHLDIAKALATTNKQENIENLAYHYSQTEKNEKAFEYSLLAAELCCKQYLYNAATDYYQKALSLEHAIPQKKLDILNSLGDIYLRCGKYSKALSIYENAFSIAKEYKLKNNNTYKGLGDSSFKKGLFDKAISYYQQLLKNLRNQGEKIAEELSVMASIYIVIGDYDKSEKLLKESLSLAKTEKNEELKASLYSSFAAINFMRGQLPNAMNYYLLSFEILHTVENLHLKAKVAHGIARLHIRKRRIDVAYRYLEETLYICEMINDNERFITAKTDMGKLFVCRGEFSQAIKMYGECLDIAQENDCKTAEAYASIELANSLRILGKNGLPFAERALQIFSDLKNQSALAECYKILGEIYIAEGEQKKAEKAFLKSENTFLNINMKWGLSGAYLGLSQIQKNEKEYTNKMLNRALKISKRYDDDLMTAKIQIKYGEFCAINKDGQKSIENFVSAIMILERITSKLELADAYFAYGKNLLEFEKQGDKGFARVAMHQLEKAKEIYTLAGITKMQNKASILIKECKREEKDTGSKRDLDVKLRKFGEKIILFEREYVTKIENLKLKMGEMDEDMEISAIEETIINIQREWKEKFKNLTQENAELVKEVQGLKTERESLLTLQKVSTKINSVLEDSEELFDLIMDMAIQELKAERGFVVLKKEDKLTFKAARNMDEKEPAQDADLSTSIVQKVIQTGEPILTSDAQADGRFQSQSIVDLKLRSILCVPLTIKDKNVGAIYIDNRLISGLFTDSDLDFLIAFSHQAAIALENAFLYEEVREKERIEQEISIAANIQAGLLPKKVPNISGISVYGKMRPASEVGGDYYDFITSAQNDTLSIVIGDVSGKGVPAGLVMVMARLILHHFLHDGFNTRETLLETNRLLKNNTEPFMFMSMLLVRWNSVEEKLVYTGAGHENIIIVRKQQDKIEVIPAGGVVLGVKENITEQLQEKELQLESGDSLILYTDGVTEAMSYSGDMLEMDGFLEIVKKHKEKTPKNIVDGIFEDLDEFMKDKEQYDDITLTVLQKI